MRRLWHLVSNGFLLWFTIWHLGLAAWGMATGDYRAVPAHIFYVGVAVPLFVIRAAVRCRERG